MSKGTSGAPGWPAGPAAAPAPEVLVAHLGPDLDDATLVRAVQAGEQEAFDVLFRRHYATVRRVCARRLASVGEAEEIAQASFVRAYERIDQCTEDRRFGAWVQVIAFRLCADAWRVRARTTPMAEPSLAGGEGVGGHESCEDALLRSERAAAVRRALSALPRRQREVIVARDLEGRRPREVAAALAVSVGAVDSLLLRARRRMVAACRATGVEHGGVSAQVSTSSLAATSAASSAGPLVRPLARMVESVTAAVDAAGAGVAATLGLGSAGPTVAQRVAGLVGAGALALTPLAPGGGPGDTSVPAAPGVVAVVLPASLPGRLVGGIALPAPGSVALPGGTVPQIPAVAVPSATLPAVPALPAVAVPGAVAVPAVPGAGALPDAAAVLAGPTAAADELVDSLAAAVGSVQGLVSAALAPVAALPGAPPDGDQPSATEGLLRAATPPAREEVR